MIRLFQEKPVQILDRKNKVLTITVPKIEATDAIELLMNGLEWIFQEFTEDCERYKDSREAMADKDFVIRNTTRTLAYANHAWALEKTVQKTHELTINFLEKEIPTFQVDHAEKVSLQKAGFERTRNFRRKVAAHPAYADPWAEDNLSTQLSSLIAITKPGCADPRDPTSFCLSIHKVEFLGHEGTPEIPPINIKTTHNFLVGSHYPKWGYLIDEALKKAHLLLQLVP